MDIKRLLLKLLLLGSPFMALLVIYLLTDPYSMYFPERWPLRKVRLVTSYDYVATEKFIEQNEIHHYNSFVFGNSRSYVFLSSEWSLWLDKSAVVYKWGEPGESIQNIRKKLELILANGNQLDNALVVMDYHLINNFQNTDPQYQTPAFIHHPLTSNSSWIGIHESFFNYYITDFMFVRHIDYAVTGNYKPYMRNYFTPEDHWEFITSAFDEEFSIHNQVSLRVADSILIADSVNYIHTHVTDTADRSEWLPRDSILKDEDIEDLYTIARIFRENGTNFKIIIGPNSDHRNMNPVNLAILRHIFGAENVYDFSGDNAYSADPGNFYDNGHFRTRVAADILDTIYRQPISPH